MKKMKKFVSLLLTVIMVLSMSATAFAQDATASAEGPGTITISNAAKGETYSVYKLFDATVSADGKHIAYTGNIPDSLKTYFTKDSAGNISATVEAKNGDGMSDGLKAALTAWVKTASALKVKTAVEGTLKEVEKVESDGSVLNFKGLDYGYYIVTTSQGEAAISVDSTNPTAKIVDKNSTTPTVVKKVDDADVAIGQKVTYTATFTTANFISDDDKGETSERVYKYVISDTLPEFLKDVKVTGITIDGTAYTVDDKVPQFDNKSITIKWVDDNGNSIYKNGAKIVLTYEATVTDKIVIDGTTGNINKVTLKPYKKNDVEFDKEYSDEEKIFSYATALKKVDGQTKDALAGAKFAAKGLTVTGEAGNYTVVSYDPDATTNGTEMECDDEGNLVIKGLPSDAKLVVTETEAPAGYNKLTETEELPVWKIGEVVTTTSTKIYYDEEGNVTTQETKTYTTKVTYNVALVAKAIVVENNAGALLPSTGGMGTTIFYVIGSILVLGAAILLVAKKRMSMDK